MWTTLRFATAKKLCANFEFRENLKIQLQLKIYSNLALLAKKIYFVS